MGKVYIASMNLRGKWAEKPDNTIVLNVTSAQKKNSDERITFSPMTHIENGYKGYWCFENYWQSGKIYDTIPEEKSKSWWINLNEPKRKYPAGKGKQVLYSNYDGKIRNYIESRKEIYVPEYFSLIENNPISKKWSNIIKKGKSIVVYDFDGPRDKNNQPICEEVNLNLLIEKINNPIHPFGHGYIVAGFLAGINPEQYIK